MQRFVQWGVWSLLGTVLAFLFAIDITFVVQEGRREARAESAPLFHASQVSRESRNREQTAVRAISLSDADAAKSASVPGVEWKRAWLRYHRHILPIAVATFFLTFGLWSLLAVENLAIRTQSS
ncbi:hypothetical protein SH501x_004958 [Pirellulaceae bacterium SH501]